MATYNLTSSIPAASSIKTGDILNCPYSGTYKTITLPKGTYKLECWGASGGNTTYGGKGAYVKGTINFNTQTQIYLYAGGSGTQGNQSSTIAGGFNGGGACPLSGSWYSPYPQSGGGASDIRIKTTSLYSRVLVAGGGGGSSGISGSGGYGGAAGGASSASGGTVWCCGDAGGGASQTSGGIGGAARLNAIYSGIAGNFGNGGSGSAKGNYNAGSGGGGGFYGGGGSAGGCGGSGGGGGSSYVYTSSTASNYPSGCTLDSSYYLTNTTLSAGNVSFTNYSGSVVTGNTGSGYVRITVLDIAPAINASVKINDVWKTASSVYVNINGVWKQASQIKTNINGTWK